MRRGCEKQRLLYLMYGSGAQSIKYVDCATWDCEVCARKRLAALSIDLLSVADGDVGIAAMRGTSREKVKKALQRAKAASLRLTLHGDGVLFVADVAVRGQGWALEKVTLAEAAIRLAGWQGETPKRAAWVGWKPERAVAEREDEVIFKAIFGSNDEAEAVLADAGIDVFSDVVGDEIAAIEAGDRLRSVIAGEDDGWFDLETMRS